MDNTMDWQLKICCIGAGYVGGTSMAVMAQQCPKVHFTVIDDSVDKIAAWNSDAELPIYEPGLLEIVQACRNVNLVFSTDAASAIAAADIIFICVNAPTKKDGIGAGQAQDIVYCETCARTIAAAATTSKIVVEKGSFPVHTAQAIARILAKNSPTEGMEPHVVLSNPVFLSEGTAVSDMLHPGRVLIGGSQCHSQAVQTLVDLYAQWVPRDKILTASTWSSELTKLCANALLAQRVSSINSISALCEATGADVTEISKAVGMDDRIGSKFLQASVGFGKARFRKDILSLVYLARQYGLHQVADYWQNVILINDFQKKRFSRKVVSKMFNTVTGKKMAMLGYAFKKDTGDVRETPSMYVLNDLIQEEAVIHIYDPKVLRSNMLQELNQTCGVNATNTPKLSEFVVTATDPYQACEGAHALLILTDWDVFKDYDYHKIYQSMAKPAFVFDGRNLLDHDDLRQIGFEVHGIGKPDPNDFTDL